MTTEMHNQLTTIETNWILSHISNYPMKLTYLAIGGANNGYQQIPLFLMPFIKKFNIRIIIIDPVIENIPLCITSTNNFLIEQDIHYTYIDKSVDCPSNIKLYQMILGYPTDYIEIITIKRHSYHNLLNNNINIDFYEQLISTILSQYCYLIGYDFSGYDIMQLNNFMFKKICNSSDTDLQSQFIKSILLDFTYGKELSCLPLLTSLNNFPLISYNFGSLEFINFNTIPITQWNSYLQYINNNILNNTTATNTFTEHQLHMHIQYCLLKHTKYIEYDILPIIRRQICYIKLNNLDYNYPNYLIFENELITILLDIEQFIHSNIITKSAILHSLHSSTNVYNILNIFFQPIKEYYQPYLKFEKSNN